MRHKLDTRKFGRDTAHRKAMWRNMATSLLREGRVRTTEAKAKELRRVADKLVTLAKHADQFTDPDAQKVVARKLHLRRQALSFVMDRDVVAKLFDELGPRYAERPGGYTRVIKIGQRKGDGAPMALVELVEAEVEEKGKKKGKKAGAKKKEAAKPSKPKAAARAETKTETKAVADEPAAAAATPPEPEVAATDVDADENKKDE
jgi:large subunit ribosomal protein L17